MNSFHRMGLLFEQNVTLLVWKSPRAQCEFLLSFLKISSYCPFTFVMIVCLKFD